jgi:hypothetical protein
LWEELEKIQGAGNSQTEITYEVTDSSPWPGLSYYRLKQTDFDGSFTYSPIERIQISERPNWRVYPNPSTGQFRLTGGIDASPEKIRLLNAIGKLIHVPVSVDKGDLVIDAQSIPQGLYILQISGGRTITSLRIIKN